MDFRLSPHSKALQINGTQNHPYSFGCKLALCTCSDQMNWHCAFHWPPQQWRAVCRFSVSKRIAKVYLRIFGAGVLLRTTGFNDIHTGRTGYYEALLAMLTTLWA
jgi:hypothetical protein